MHTRPYTPKTINNCRQRVHPTQTHPCATHIQATTTCTGHYVHNSLPAPTGYSFQTLLCTPLEPTLSAADIHQPTAPLVTIATMHAGPCVLSYAPYASSSQARPHYSQRSRYAPAAAALVRLSLLSTRAICNDAYGSLCTSSSTRTHTCGCAC